MKKFQKLHMYPLGAIRAEGFLKEQLERGKDGIAGHLYELEPNAIAAPYVEDVYIKNWSKVEQVGWQAEISGNYWTGYIQHAFTLNDPEMIARATKWVDDMLKTQLENGYLGTYRTEDCDIYDDFNSANALAYRGLIAFYEATGRKDVLEALHRTCLWFCDTWAGDKKTFYAGPIIIDAMIPVYHLTGDTRLRDFCVDYMEFLANSIDPFKRSYKTMLEEDVEYLMDHAVAVPHGMMEVGFVYTATGEQKYLDAALRRLQLFRKKAVHITGGASCAAEYVAPIGSNLDYEYCGFTRFIQTYSLLGSITGDPEIGDFMENVFYNAAQGARKKNERAIAYLSSPNQLFATERSSSYGTSGQLYSPCHTVACCAVNAVVILPEFVRAMLLHDEDNNVYAFAYGPCALEHDGIALTEKTLYPFRNTVRFEIGCDKTFALNLKVPTWAKGYTVTVNGETIDAKAEGGFVKLERAWKSGDAVEIEFGMETEVLTIDDSDAASKFPLAIRRGALVYSLHVPEKWVPHDGGTISPMPEGWKSYRVNADYTDADVADFHERIGLRRHQFSWNIAVDENLSPADIEVEERPVDGYVWENPPIVLHTKAYRAEYMNAAPYQRKTFETFGKYQAVTGEIVPLTLEPYGCTNLRITYFPKADPKAIK